MLNRFLNLLFLLALLSESKGQKNTISFQLKKDTLSFASHSVFHPDKALTDISKYKIPEGIREYRILNLHLQLGQFYKNHEAELNKINDSSFQTSRRHFLNYYNRTTYTDSMVDESIKILSYLDLSNHHSIIIDTDNDYDFTNEQVLTSTFLEETHKLSADKRPFFTVTNISFYDDKSQKIVKTRANISPDIYSLAFSGFTDTLANVEIRARTYPHIAVLNIDKARNQYLLAVTQRANQLFDSAYTVYLIADTTNPSPIRFGDFLKQGELFYTNNRFYKILGTDVFGSEVQIEKISDVAVHGYRPGFIGPNVVSTDIVSNASFDSKKVDENYILLDFWGTWCAPCIKTIPILKNEIQHLHSKKVKLVSIAWDTDVDFVKNYIKGNGITWTNLFEDRRKLALSKIVLKGFNVAEFPTFILMDKNGKIVKREAGESGLQSILSFIDTL